MKVVIVGDAGVGKTSMLTKLTTGFEFAEHRATIGSQYFQYRDMHLWDTSGDERFRKMIAGYVSDADMVIFVHDLSNSQTLEHIFTEWQRLYIAPLTVLVGTKSDLQADRSYKFEPDQFDYLTEVQLSGDSIQRTFDQLIEMYEDQHVVMIESKRRRYCSLL